MKQRISLLLCAALLAALAGCAAPGEASSASGSPAQSAPHSQEQTLQPIYASQIRNGSYEIQVDSSASMFRVVHCTLVVEDDTMYAAMTMSGKGYGYVYMGTAEQALSASEESWIPFTQNEQGGKVFTVPVQALDQETDCAAWSIRKEKWYDRTLVFQSDLIPADAIGME